MVVHVMAVALIVVVIMTVTVIMAVTVVVSRDELPKVVVSLGD